MAARALPIKTCSFPPLHPLTPLATLRPTPGTNSKHVWGFHLHQPRVRRPLLGMEDDVRRKDGDEDKTEDGEEDKAMAESIVVPSRGEKE